MRSNRLLDLTAVVCAAVVWGGGCSERVTQGDGESHFLAQCPPGCAAGLECICGVCTRACGDDDACSSLAQGATCVERSGCSAPRVCGAGITADSGAGSDEQATSTGDAATDNALVPSAAVVFTVSPALGETCTTTNPVLAIPSAHVASVLQELSCNQATGCQPDEYLVADRSAGTLVSCSLQPSSGSYAVTLRIDADGSASGNPSLTFSLTGLLSSTGGTVAIAQTNSEAGGGGSDPACTVTISPPGLIEGGKIRASFDCSNFRDTTNLGDTGCVMSGRFLFENCME